MSDLEITRRRWLEAAAAAGLALSGPARALAAPSSALTFLGVGDWGRDGAYHQSDVARQMGVTASALGARFVFSVGDNFYDDGVQSVDDPKWRTSFEDVYTAPSLQVPWRVALGNHDYHGRPEAQIAYSRVSKRWRMPDRYFVVSERAPDGTTLDLFVTDTSPMVRRYWEGGEAKTRVADQDVTAQLKWLDAALAASKADWKIVIGHHPVYTGGEHGDTAELVAHVLPLLKRHGVPLYVNGHDHDLQHIERDGMTFVCTGAGSKVRVSAATEGSRFYQGVSGFTAYALDRSGLSIAFVDYEGRTLHEARMAPPLAKAA